MAGDSLELRRRLAFLRAGGEDIPTEIRLGQLFGTLGKGLETIKSGIETGRKAAEERRRLETLETLGLSPLLETEKLTPEQKAAIENLTLQDIERAPEILSFTKPKIPAINELFPFQASEEIEKSTGGKIKKGQTTNLFEIRQELELEAEKRKKITKTEEENRELTRRLNEEARKVARELEKEKISELREYKETRRKIISDPKTSSSEKRIARKELKMAEETGIIPIRVEKERFPGGRFFPIIGQKVELKKPALKPNVAGTLVFDSKEEALAADFPKPAIVIIDGRKALIK